MEAGKLIIWMADRIAPGRKPYEPATEYATRVKTRARFIECLKVEGDCLIWAGTVNGDGYPLFAVNGSERRAPFMFMVDEWMADLRSQMSPMNWEGATHVRAWLTCKRKRCVNPYHRSNKPTTRPPWANMDDEQVAALRRDARSMDPLYGNTELAKMYGINISCVKHAIKGESYASVPGALTPDEQKARTMALRRRTARTNWEGRWWNRGRRDEQLGTGGDDPADDCGDADTSGSTEHRGWTERPWSQGQDPSGPGGGTGGIASVSLDG